MERNTCRTSLCQCSITIAGGKAGDTYLAIVSKAAFTSGGSTTPCSAATCATYGPRKPKERDRSVGTRVAHFGEDCAAMHIPDSFAGNSLVCRLKGSALLATTVLSRSLWGNCK
jgi:hypothetical protein